MRSLYISLLSAIVFSVSVGFATAAEPSQQTIVYIGGAKYYIHTVSAGETLYSVSRLYGVTVEDILKHNPSAADGLRRDSTLTIPVPDMKAKEQREEAAAKKRRKDFEIHTVEAGETLYSVSRRYEITVDDVLADNPDVDAFQLPIGTKLYIRKSSIGSAPAVQTTVAVAEQPAAPEGYFYYTVQAGETIYSLCRRFGVTESEIRTLNDMPDGLKAGAAILLPSGGKNSVHTPEPSVQLAQQQTVEDAHTARSYRNTYTEFGFRSTGFRVLDPRDVLRVALMLPMSRNGSVNNHYIDFYRGFLLGAEAVKAAGYSIDLTLFDTEQTPATTEHIVAEEFPYLRPDLIIGPVYESVLAPVIAYAEQENVPVVSPLASLASTDSRVLFQMSPDASRKYDKVYNLFDGSRDVTLIYGESVDRDFEREVLSLLEGKRYATHHYVYEHQSVIERREKANAAKGIENASSGPGDMTVLLRRSKNNVFVVLSDNETEVDRILAALASADISLRTRERTVSRFVVFGSSKWNRYSNLDSSIFFRDGLVSLSSYTARRDNVNVREFDDRYISDFNTMPSPYSYRGYDAAVIFCTAMFCDIESGIMMKRYVPLQTGYMFERAGGGLRAVNTEWMRTDYHDDFTIKVE